MIRTLLSLPLMAGVCLLMFSTEISAYPESRIHQANYKGDMLLIACPRPLQLRDGFYLGILAGYDTFKIQNNLPAFTDFEGDITVSDNLTVNMTGPFVGGFIGYGSYIERFYGAYIGLEVFGQANTTHTDFEVKHSVLGVTHTFLTQWDTNGKAGFAFLPGVKLTPGTLAYVRLGYNWAKVNVTERLADSANPLPPVLEPDPFLKLGDQSRTLGGFQCGVGVESTFYDNLSIRFEYAHTNYASFTSDLNAQVDPSDGVLNISMIYHV